MSIGIGIDTGGTYTDSVIYEFHTRKILSSAKALTTKHDLSVGIKNTLDCLDSTLLHQAELVSLSTTLATNACVEKKGGRAKLLFIGVDKKIVDRVGAEYGLTDIKKIYFVEAETTVNGKITKAPDWAAFLKESKQWLNDAEALGIVQLNAMYNGAVLEEEAKSLIVQNYDIPVVCGNELFSELNSIRRGSSALLNGMLISVLVDFLSAIKKALKERNITAPITIVRSDGSLMSEQIAGLRPVETILSGPAASVMGSSRLADEKEAVIVDMGGTTTDIALVRKGQPVTTRDGINIGNWRTFVKGLYVETLGLGGDSAIRYNTKGQVLLDTDRVIPLSVGASQWPELIDMLEELQNFEGKHSFLPYEFFTLVKDITNSPFYNDQEKQFCGALQEGPLSFAKAAAAANNDVYSLDIGRLEKEGIVLRCGLTPTDIMHLQGDYTKYPTQAAELGAQFIASSVGMTVRQLGAMVYDTVKKKLYDSIVQILLKENMPRFNKTGFSSEVRALLDRSWDMAQGKKSEHLNFGFKTSSVLIGAGAPIHVFLPDVAQVLGATCLIPKHAEVANAIGAVSGNITASYTIQIQPHEEGYIVFGPSGNYTTQNLEKATAIAQNQAEQEARAEAIRRGASKNMVVETTINPLFVRTKSGKVFIDSKIVATAIDKMLN